MLVVKMLKNILSLTLSPSAFFSLIIFGLEELVS